MHKTDKTIFEKQGERGKIYMVTYIEISMKGFAYTERLWIFFEWKHVVEEIWNVFIANIYYFEWYWRIHNQMFTFSECKDVLTGLCTSQPIAVVALSTAPVRQPRAPSAGAPTVCPLAPHPPAPQQLPLACQAGSSWEACPALPYTSNTRSLATTLDQGWSKLGDIEYSSKHPILTLNIIPITTSPNLNILPPVNFFLPTTKKYLS